MGERYPHPPYRCFIFGVVTPHKNFFFFIFSRYGSSKREKRI